MTVTGSREALKPCPFCGVEPSLTNVRDVLFTVHCSNDDCHPRCEVDHTDPIDVVKAWNTRAADPAPVLTVEDLTDLARAINEEICAQLDRGVNESLKLAAAVSTSARVKTAILHLIQSRSVQPGDGGAV